ncbi:hypothetical protein ATG_16720 [Desulfurococcaceae archaeon AG1]|jgi:archaellum component FlaG (FlaF/FlaG flagellin family)|nr:MAG: hypothetical protein DJ555_01985 [Desulfurococcaceae archaeon]GAY26468.1 hypothetical protein ATG_16720 [Desulfurococcaceae archaeon AG1]
MVSTPITEGILLVASVTIAAVLSAAVLSKVYLMDSLFSQISSIEKNNAQIRLKLVYLACNSSTNYVVYVKNIGIVPVNLSSVDILIGVPGSEAPLWLLGGSSSILIQGGGQVLPQGSIGVINITLPNPLQTNIVSVRIIYPNGVSEYSVCSF